MNFKFEINDKVKTNYGTGIIIERKIVDTFGNCEELNAYLIKYDNNERLYALEDVIEKIKN